MQLQKIKVKSIKKLDYANQVYDLSVEKNRNFFIGNTEILTHNCDSHSYNAYLVGCYSLEICLLYHECLSNARLLVL